MKRVVCFLLVIMLVLGIFAVSAGGQKEKFVIGFTPKALVSVYYVTMTDAIKEIASKKENIELLVASPVDQRDLEGQIRIIEDFTQKGVDLIAASVNDPGSVVPSLLEAQNAGIPIMILDTIWPLEGIEVLSLIGADEVAGGEMVGEYAVEILNGKGKIAIIEGVPGHYCSECRLEGFKNVLNRNPDIKIVASQPADWDRSKAMSTMENILQANPDIDLVWGQNDGMALGALKAIEDAGLLSQIKVMGYNGDLEALKAVKDGKMVSTAALQPVRIAETVIEVGEMIAEGRIKEVESVIPIPVVLVTKENVDRFLE